MAAAQASIAVPGCRKMSRSNTCRKSHFVRKIYPGPSNSEKRRKDEKERKWEWDEQLFSARSAIFCLPQIDAFAAIKGRGPIHGDGLSRII